tara:strand:- start:1030 stop:1620 length:591 start_codon:yes stop_codon:yes gene_type:complete
MGINSTEVAYGFGQLGSTITQLAAQTVTAPENHVIVAIQFLADTKLSALVAEDSQKYFNSIAASHTGEFTRIVNQTGSTTNIIKFDDGAGNPISNATAGCQVGDHVYDSTGVLHGKVIALDPNGDDTSEIMISNSVAITDNEVLHFSSKALPVGGGGQQLGTGDIFPKGLTIYGRWTSMSLNDDDTDGGAICYFGK